MVKTIISIKGPNRPFYNLILIALACCVSCTCQSDQNQTDINGQILALAKSFSLDKEEAKTDLEYIAAEPHPFGSDRQKIIGTWISEKAKKLGAEVVFSDFTADTPNPALLKDPAAPANQIISKSGRNIFARANINSSSDCIVLMGSHYDSKKIEGLDYLGANDSGSSSILLLQILKFIKSGNFTLKTECDIGFIWFDGEEAILPNWTDGLNRHPAKIQDNTYGSRDFAEKLVPCSFLDTKMFCINQDSKSIPLVSLILLDMIGSESIKLSLDSFSSKIQLDTLKLANSNLTDNSSPSATLSSTSTGIEDDHIPFRKKKISAIDIIDFNHLNYWHKAGDDPENISYESIDFAGKISIFLVLANATSPKAFIETPDK